MAGITHLLREAIDRAFQSGTPNEKGWLNQWLASFRETLLPELKEGEFADIFAQTLAYGLFAARIQTASKHTSFSREQAAFAVPRSNPFLRSIFSQMAGAEMPEVFAWAVDDLVRLLQYTDIASVLRDFGHATGQNDPVVHFYETFLAAYDPMLREKRGVYYTPEPVVRYIVRSVDHLLKTHFNKPKGLADEQTLILDPATGTATFLYFIIQHIDQGMAGQRGSWPGYVADHLLQRIFGFELLMAPYAIAHLKLALELERTKYTFREDQRLGIYLTNTLEEAAKKSELLVAKAISDEANAAAEIKREKPIMVVIGNPPYSGISANRSEFIRHIARGQTYTVTKQGQRREQTVRIEKTAKRNLEVKEKTFIGRLMDDYKWVDGVRIRDKKTWMNNDYAKFIRFAQWRIEESRQGIVAFITDNSYLDKSSFRGMRQSLLGAFSKIFIYNLHGSSKPKEVPPDGGGDQNVFDIQQGVAIILAVKKRDGPSAIEIQYADLWGERQEKYTCLQNEAVSETAWQKIVPGAPLYLFCPASSDDSTYKSWPGLNEVFNVFSSGITTARDYFVIALSKKELTKRIEDFCDLDLNDEQVRTLYFKGKGSEKYADGDSRGWKLEKARHRVIQDKERLERIRNVLYRPFDKRFIYWAPWMIDWPRPEVMDQMEVRENIAFLFSRNVEIGRAEHFFCCDGFAGHHSVSLKEVNYQAPLWRYTGKGNGNLFAGRRPNLSRAFLDALAENLHLPQEPEFGLPEDVSPEDIFHYIYAIFHAPGYRSRYAEFLKRDFPRVPLTADLTLFRALAAKGSELVALHLLKVEDAPQLNQFATQFRKGGTDMVDKVKYDADTQRVWINDDQYFEGVPAETWNFHIGGYQVCEKWLKDRKGRTLSYDDLQHWQRIVVALTETRRLMQEIDALIPAWPLQ